MQKNYQTSNKIRFKKFSDIPLFWQDRNRDALKLNLFSEAFFFFLVKICEALNVGYISEHSVKLFPPKMFFFVFQCIDIPLTLFHFSLQKGFFLSG